MDTTCALAIITPSEKVLLVHPTGAGYFGSWSLPKGKRDAGETELEAAIREVYEETSLDVKAFAGKLVDLGNYAYTKEKRYHIFKLDYPKEIDAKSLKCISTFSDFGTEILECDKFQMASLDDCKLLLNPKQSKIVMSLKDKILA